MESVRKGLRAGQLDKDTYGRLECSNCEVGLTKKEAEDDMGYLHTCPDCGRVWRRVD
ncbi:MAG: HVO_0758 family zinc finger protein [Halobacteriales archaeon]|nr:HVO_0758 family zinc finger protein [Halobacteriales archaeon]